MKTMTLSAALLTSLSACAEGPILRCKATREGPRSDGRPGYEKIDEKSIITVIDSRIKTTELIGATVKTYVNVKGDYVLVLSDKDLDASSTSMGTLDNKHINLSLSGRGLSNFVTCEVQ